MKIKIALFFLIILAINSFSEENLISIDTRKNITQDFLVSIESDNPKAVVLLFPGGSGRLKLYKDKNEWSLNNFLIRSREYFVKEDFIVVSMDAPSDKRDKNGMYYGFRTSDEHLVDIVSVIKYVKEKYNKPIWVVGTSRGTESVSNLAIKTKKLINGLVLTSSITVANQKGASLTNMHLEEISIPTLVIAHNNDECRITPPSGAKMIYAMLKSDMKVTYNNEKENISSTSGSKVIYEMLKENINKELKYFDGGESEGNPCKAFAHHGYFKIEKEVVKYISSFIENNI